MNHRSDDYRIDAILMSDPPAVFLENWSPEVRDGRIFLNGVVYGHPRMADGKYIRTEDVTWWLHEVGIAQTATANYILRNRG